ncbi:MAG: hypothetical protein WBD20_20705 [Pirellulaceae bacterium]
MDNANILWNHHFGSKEDGYAIFSIESNRLSLLAINDVARELLSIGDASLDAVEVQDCLAKARISASDISSLEVDGDLLVRRLARHQVSCSLRQSGSNRYAILNMIQLQRCDVQRLCDQSNSAAMAHWTASIAHELSQPIHVMQNAVSIIEMRRSAGTDTAEAIKPCLDLLQDASTKAAATIATLKEAVSPWLSKLAKCDLVVAIDDLVANFNTTLDSWIEFERPDCPIDVKVDRAQFDVLLAGLLIIFRKCSPDSTLPPKITIRFDQANATLELLMPAEFALHTELFSVPSKDLLSSVTLESCRAIASANNIGFKVMPSDSDPSACMGFQLSLPPHESEVPDSISRRFARRLWD